MRNRNIFLLSMAAGLLASVLWLHACAGQKAREFALLPAVRLSWPSVAADIERGLVDATDDGDLLPSLAANYRADLRVFEAALKDEDRESMLGAMPPDWRAVAERGVQDRVDDGEIVPEAAASLLERIEQFDQALAKLAERL